MPSHKNCILLLFFNTSFQITIVRSYRAPCLFCMLTLLKLALCSHPDLARSKNPMENVLINKFNISKSKTTLTVLDFFWLDFRRTTCDICPHCSTHFQSSNFSKKSITRSPTTFYCYRIYRSLSNKLRCHTRISSPEKSRNEIREKMLYFSTCV